MGRTRYIVTYDISHPRRLRKVARTLEGFGVRIQLSVFECPLDPIRLAKAKAQLTELINHEEDQILFIALGPSASDANLKMDALGKPYSVRRSITII